MGWLQISQLVFASVECVFGYTHRCTRLFIRFRPQSMNLLFWAILPIRSTKEACKFYVDI